MASKIKKKSKADLLLERAGKILRLLSLALPLPLILILHYEFDLFSDGIKLCDSSVTFQTFISAFAGAAGAAGLFYLLDQKQKKRDLLRAINTSLALMAGHISTVINYKKQHLIPLKEEKDALDRFIETVHTIRSSNPNVEINPPAVAVQHMMQKLPAMQDEFLLNLEKLSEFSEKFPMAIVYLVKAKDGLNSFKSFVKDWRDLVDEIRNTKYEPEGAKIAYLMGKVPMNGSFDTRLPNIIDHMLSEADNALFFLRNASEELREKGALILPKGVSQRLAESTTKTEYEKYMPPRDHIEGWDDE